MPEVSDRREFPATWTNEEFQQWLCAQMNGERKWLLAHADDGVIWGRWENGALITSNDVAPNVSPELRLITLQQVFIFGERDELKIWRDEDGEATSWRARRLSDGEDADVVDEPQLLWGSEIVEWPDDFDGMGFTHVRERKSNYGMDHVVPIEVTKDDLDNSRLKLLVRHFITYDEQTGEARIALSRLGGLEHEPPPEQQKDE